MDSHKKPDSLLSFESLENGLLSTIDDFSDKNDSLSGEGLLMKKRIHEMSELPNDSVCSTSFDNEEHRFCQLFAQEISRRPFAPFTAAINAFKKMDEQTKWVVREDGADSLKNKIAELEKTMSLEKEQYENEIELLKYEKQEITEQKDALEQELIEKMEIICEDKACVIRSKMSNEMKLSVVCSGIKAVEKCKRNKNCATRFCSDVAIQICGELHEKYGPDWQAFVIAQTKFQLLLDRDFGWGIQGIGNNYVDFAVDGIRICVFKPDKYQTSAEN